MPNLPHRLSDAMDVLSGREVSIGRRPMPSRVQRAVHEAVAVEYGRGSVQAARVRALEQVADEAMQATGRLSQLEAFWTQHAPHGAGRYQAIADVAAMAMANIVAETGRE
jgi:hypothetical protein